MGFLELVLHVEKPYALRPGQHGDRQMHQQEGEDPIAHISIAAMTVIARFVAMADIQGSEPARIMPKGSRCLNRNSRAGPMPNMIAGCPWSR